MIGEWITFKLEDDDNVTTGLVKHELNGFYVVDTDAGLKRVWPEQIKGE